MPRFREVEYYLRGLWLLIFGQAQGFSYLDLSERGAMRSFWAIVWCLPATLTSWIWWRAVFLGGYPPGTKAGLSFFLRLAMVEAMNWILPLVLTGFVCLLLGFRQRFFAIVTVSNWLSVPMAYSYASVVLLAMFLPGMRGLASLLWLLLILILIFSLIRLLRMICGPQPLTIAALTLVLLVPSMFLSSLLQQYLGIYPV